MPDFCSAAGCHNSTDNSHCREKGVSFHHFPLKDRTRLSEWTSQINRSNFNPTRHSVLCSDHFEQKYFVYQPFTNRRQLSPEAVPTIFTRSDSGRNKKKFKADSEVQHNSDPYKLASAYGLRMDKASSSQNAAMDALAKLHRHDNFNLLAKMGMSLDNTVALTKQMRPDLDIKMLSSQPSSSKESSYSHHSSSSHIPHSSHSSHSSSHQGHSSSHSPHGHSSLSHSLGGHSSTQHLSKQDKAYLSKLQEAASSNALAKMDPSLLAKMDPSMLAKTDPILAQLAKLDPASLAKLDHNSLNQMLKQADQAAAAASAAATLNLSKNDQAMLAQLFQLEPHKFAHMSKLDQNTLAHLMRQDVQLQAQQAQQVQQAQQARAAQALKIDPAQFAQLSKMDPHLLSKLDPNTLAYSTKQDVSHALSKLDQTTLAQMVKMEAQSLSKSDVAQLTKLDSHALQKQQQQLQQQQQEANLLSKLDSATLAQLSKMDNKMALAQLAKLDPVTLSKLDQFMKMDQHAQSKLDVNTLAQLVKMDSHPVKIESQLAQIAKMDAQTLAKLDANTLAQVIKLDSSIMNKLDPAMWAHISKMQAQQMHAAAVASGLSKADLAEFRKMEADHLSRLQPSDVTDTSLLSPAGSTSSSSSSSAATSGSGEGGSAAGASGEGGSKYQRLLAVIEEMGKDIRPTYAGSKSSADRLKRGIVHARILARECLVETERAARA